MATQTAAPSDFIKNLGRMYGTYTGGFVASSFCSHSGAGRRAEQNSRVPVVFSRSRSTPSSAS